MTNRPLSRMVYRVSSVTPVRALKWKLLNAAIRLDPKHFDHWHSAHIGCRTTFCPVCKGLVCGEIFGE